MTTYLYVNDGMTIAEAQEYMCNLVDDYRKAWANTYFTYNNIPWDCNDEGIRNIIATNLLSVLNGGNLPAGFIWRDYNNVNQPVDAQTMGALAAAALTFQSACYQTSWIHKANIRALTDLISLDSYQYIGVNWPSQDS